MEKAEQIAAERAAIQARYRQGRRPAVKLIQSVHRPDEAFSSLAIGSTNGLPHWQTRQDVICR